MQEKKNKLLSLKTLKAVCFLVGLCFLLAAVNHIFMRKEAEAKYRDFYKYADDYDVLITGISHMKAAVSPMELWNDYGITAFNLAGPRTYVFQNYWVIKNALQYCNPKLIVVDVRRMELQQDKGTADLLLHRQFDSMPLSKVKWDAAMDMYDSWDDRMGMLIPFTTYHSRWDELGKNDFLMTDYVKDRGVAHYYENDSSVYVPSGKFKLYEQTKKKTGSDEAIEYLRRIIELCREKGIEVLLMNVPYPPVSPFSPQLYENGIADIAEEYGVDYLNFMHIDDNVVDIYTDFKDRGHVNDSGMKKITEYLGSYLCKNYDIPSHKEDLNYAYWYDDFDSYTDYKFDMLSCQKEADTYFVLLADKNVSSCIYIMKDSAVWEDETCVKLLQNVALKGNLEKFQEAKESREDYFLLVDRNGGKVMEYVGEDVPESLQTTFGMVCFARETDGGLRLNVDDPETNYFANGADSGADIWVAAIDTFSGCVRDTGYFKSKEKDKTISLKRVMPE